MGLHVTNPVKTTISFTPPPGPKLSLFVNEAGQVDARYKPEDLTEAAHLLIAEMRRIQTSIPESETTE